MNQHHKMPFLDFELVLPCYRPIPGWQSLLVQHCSELGSFLPGDIRWGVTIVDDGNAKDIAFEGAWLSLIPAGRVLRHTVNQGKGRALRTGIASSRGAVTVFTDIDFPYEMRSLADVISALLEKAGPDVVLGRRSRDYYDKKVPPFRKLLSLSLRIFLKWILFAPTDDSQCGLKGMNRKGKEVFLKGQVCRYLVDLEFLLLLAEDETIRIQSCPVKLRPGVIFTKLNILSVLSECSSLLNIVIPSLLKRLKRKLKI